LTTPVEIPIISGVMTCIDELITAARIYAAAEGVELKTVSWRVFGDAKKLDAITKAGADLQTRRFEGAMRWFSANWPDTVAWPSDIPRPANERAA
jgi:hypothetical protein